MTAGEMNASSEPGPSRSSLRDPAIAFAIVLAFGAIGWLMADGHPRTNWYYVYIVALALLIATITNRRSQREKPAKIQSELASLTWAVIEGLITAAAYSLFFILLWDDEFLTLGLTLGVTSGLFSYLRRRGLAQSPRITALVGGTFLIAMIVTRLVVRWVSR